MSQEDTVSYEEESEDESWSKEIIEKNKITNQEVIHKIKLYERINNSEKENQLLRMENIRLTQLVQYYQTIHLRNDSIGSSFTEENKKKRPRILIDHQQPDLEESTKKYKYDLDLDLDLDNFRIDDFSHFL